MKLLAAYLIISLLALIVGIQAVSPSQAQTSTIPPVCATATRKPTKTPTQTATPTPQGTPTATRTPGIGEPAVFVELWMPMVSGE